VKTATTARHTLPIGGKGIKPVLVFEVYCRRHDGALRLFQAYHDRDIAEKVASRLRAVGCDAEVREAKAR
jgi:hypothetical protein